MKLLKSVLENCKHLLFIDFEGTQFTHEIIAIGAVLVDCDEEYHVIGKEKTFKCLVKANSNVGDVVESMTGINDDILEKEGLSFSEAMHRLNKFIGFRGKNLKVLTYGNQDAHMLKCSYNLSDDESTFMKSFVSYITRNTVDIGVFFSRYLKGGKKNEMVSLTHMREFFSLPPSGEAHDPLVDALDLYHIYISFVSNKEVLKESYKNLVKKSGLIPQPIKSLVVRLIDGKEVTPEDLDKVLDIYFE
jgi:hypothetical protein